MDFSFDIFQIYRQYCEIMSWAYANEGQGYRSDDESQKVGRSREALARLLESLESKFCTRFSVFDKVPKLMSRLQLTTDFNEFLRFYDFVFFISRENGQKSIAVSKAIVAWRLVLAGRFRLLNQWCDFVEKNQRHNISEDTWRQVLAFSRCVHENLEGYDSEGAWPVLIDEFVEHMYRVRGSCGVPHIPCNCGDSESEQCEDTVTGLKNAPGSKRKSYDNMQIDQEFLDRYSNNSISCNVANTKRRTVFFVETSINPDQNQLIASKDESPKSAKHSTALGCNKSSPCAVEGCLSKGFAGLLSRKSCSQFHQDRKIS